MKIIKIYGGIKLNQYISDIVELETVNEINRYGSPSNRIKLYKMPESSLHPVDVVLKAQKIVNSLIIDELDEAIVLTHNPDMLSGLYYIAKSKDIKIEVYECDNSGIYESDVESLFNNFDKSLFLISKFCSTDDDESITQEIIIPACIDAINDDDITCKCLIDAKNNLSTYNLENCEKGTFEIRVFDKCYFKPELLEIGKLLLIKLIIRPGRADMIVEDGSDKIHKSLFLI